MTTLSINCKTYTKSALDYSSWGTRQLATKSYIQSAIPTIPIFLCDHISFQYGFLRNCIEFAYFYDSFCKKTNNNFLNKKNPCDFIDEKFADWMNERSARNE